MSRLSVLEISFMSLGDPVSVPVLIVSDTEYSQSVPITTGTNVLNYLKSLTLVGKIRNVGDMSSGETESTDSVMLNICPRLVKVSPRSAFSRIPVRVCNFTARPVVIHPRATLRNFQDASVIRNIVPGEGLIDKSHNSDKILA